MEIQEYFNEVKNIELDLDKITTAMEMLLYRKGRIYIIGNGGSAATASHFAVDLQKGCGLEAISLCEPGLITAIGNDIGFDKIFSYQLERFGKIDDVLVIISVSGNSPNLIEAAKYAGKNGIKVIGLLGNYGKGNVEKYCDIYIDVPSGDYGVCEDTHLMICHAIAKTIRGDS